MIVYEPESIQDAVSRLASLGARGAALAGGTWIMRAPQRGQPYADTYVNLTSIPELSGIVPGDPTVIGALTTHRDLAGVIASEGPLGGIGDAAREAAFLAINNVATIGGNVCSVGFDAADLVPPLLAADAEVEIATATETRRLPLRDYLTGPRQQPGHLLLRFHVPAPPGRASVYERFTVLETAEYAIASVALSIDLDGPIVRDVRVAVGGVESTARRVEPAEDALRGSPLTAEAAGAGAAAAIRELQPRDGLDAPAWYRLEVLPSLFRRAIERLAGRAHTQGDTP